MHTFEVFALLLIGFLAGLSVSLLVLIFGLGQKSDLKSPKLSSIIDGSALRRPTPKRVPKALTDLMAYQKELKDEGINRV